MSPPPQGHSVEDDRQFVVRSSGPMEEWLERERELVKSSPSRLDGMSFELEQRARFKMCQLLLRCCEHPKLKIRAHVRQKAMLLFQSWVNAHSLKKYDRFVVALASLYLSVKIDEELTHYEQKRPSGREEKDAREPRVRKRHFPRLIHGIVLASWDVHNQRLSEEHFSKDNEVPESSYFHIRLREDTAKELQKTLERVLAVEPALLATINFQLHIDIPVTNFLKIGKETFQKAFYKWKLSRDFGFDLLDDAICVGICNFMTARDVGGAVLLISLITPECVEVEGPRPEEGFRALMDDFADQAQVVLNRMYNHISHSVGNAKLKCSRDELEQVYSSPHAADWQRDAVQIPQDEKVKVTASEAAAPDAPRTSVPDLLASVGLEDALMHGAAQSPAAEAVEKSSKSTTTGLEFGQGLRPRAESPSDLSKDPKRPRLAESSDGKTSS